MSLTVTACRLKLFAFSIIVYYINLKGENKLCIVSFSANKECQKWGQFGFWVSTFCLSLYLVQLMYFKVCILLSTFSPPQKWVPSVIWFVSLNTKITITLFFMPVFHFLRHIFGSVYILCLFFLIQSMKPCIQPLY